MAKELKRFEVDTNWFKGKDKKLYRIIANNLVKASSAVIIIKEKNKTQVVDDELRAYDIVILTEIGNANGLKAMCKKLKLKEKIFEDSIFCLPIVIEDTWHYYKDENKKDFIRDIENKIHKLKTKIIK